MKNQVFTKRSRINAPVEEVFKWHSRPGALERLSPPWDPIEVIDRKGGIKKGAKVVLKMKAGPIPFKWVAEHTDYEENRLIRDMQIKGPFARWIHTHKFEPDGTDACFLDDRIDFSLPFHPFGNLLAGNNVLNKLERIFNYRHTTTIQDITSHLSIGFKKPMNILITGASGFIGSEMVPFLTSGGHRVIRLVRRSPVSQSDEVFWDPLSGHLNPDDFGIVDAVIHLAGENIAEGRWTEEKKRKIIESRTDGTSLIANTIGKLEPLPKVLICASAIGYYGNRGNELINEEAEPGNNFLSKVCIEWEKAAAPAIQKGIRVVFTRFGAVLSPIGGALKKLLLPFKLGLGGKIGSGNQYMSWVGIDDVITVIYHALSDSSIEGPVNVVSPNPVTNQELTRILGKVLSRPTVFSVPETAIKLFFGEMGKDALLSSTRVNPKKLMESGYIFRYPHLESALRHVLGR